jgi:2-oxo-4-hydroxy-4-carboxy-5-ureidoimidazoline decarboxylase
MTIEEFIQHPEMKELLFQCCGSSEWVKCMSSYFPFDSVQSLKERAGKCWDLCSEEDWMEAFSHHPRIGDKDALRKKFATDKWASGEQQNVSKADESVITSLQEYNDEYFDKYGFIFIICATGKSAEEMLLAIKQRMSNSRSEELIIAAGEQRKIMHLRLEKLFS